MTANIYLPAVCTLAFGLGQLNIKIQLFATSLGELIVKLRIDLSSTTQLQRLRSKAKPVQFSSASNHIMKYPPPPP